MKPSRLFWVVDSPDYNEEIFVTKKQAVKYAKRFGKQEPYTISIAEVRNFYWEKDLKGWNYDDQADTFDTIITIVRQTDTRPQEV